MRADRCCSESSSVENGQNLAIHLEGRHVTKERRFELVHVRTEAGHDLHVDTMPQLSLTFSSSRINRTSPSS